MICFLGTSHAAKTLKEGARRRGLNLTDDIHEAELIFVSEDTPTDEDGKRNLAPIRELIDGCGPDVPIVLTSQIPPGFIEELFDFWDETDQRYKIIFHQAETLRIEDGLQRAMHPEMFIVGCKFPNTQVHSEYQKYLDAFECPVLKMSYAEAAFCKIAINAILISQVETTNMLSQLAKKVGANWGKIAQALRHDSRIGKYAYLTPGCWHNSKHLLRDYVTLQDIGDASTNKLLDVWK